MSETNLVLRIFRREYPVRVLGPGARAVIWVQGCHFGCPGCIVPESWDALGGHAVEIDELAGWVLAQEGIEGVTISGGEPMNQAEGLCGLVDRIRRKADLGVICYTGFTLEHLKSRGSDGQKALLERIDLLIDGVYIAERHADLLWRGSSNQRLMQLTQRYAGLAAGIVDERGDRSAGVEMTMDDAGAIGFAGVPAAPGFRDEFEQRMAARGIRLGFGIQGEDQR